MPNIFKFSNAGGFKNLTRYPDMLAGNTVWNPYSPTGAYDALATVTVPSGGQASITFSGIPSTYTHLQLRALTRDAAAYSSDSFFASYNGDTGANYAEHWLSGNGSSASAASATSQSNMIMGTQLGSTGLANTFSAAIVDILDYANTNKYKTHRTLSGNDQNGSGTIWLSSCRWMNTSAINSITITGQGGSNLVQYSTFSLYGVR